MASIPKIPSLQTLRAFEAAVRLRSFTRAADELALTQGAISQHVRTLEAQCGLTLFVRTPDGASPTHQAQALALQVRLGLEVLVRAFANRGNREAASHANSIKPVRLRLSVLPAFSTRWLAPRLARFHEAHPDIDLQINPSVALARLDSRDQLDVALRYGPGGWSGLYSEKWMDEDVFPVASPFYCEGKLPQRFADLARCTLLRHTMQPWELWFQAAGLAMTESHSSRLFVDPESLLEAAASGEGIALGRRSLVESDIAVGRLVRLWTLSVKDVHAHFIVWRPDNPKVNAIDTLRDWLRREASSSMGKG